MQKGIFASAFIRSVAMHCPKLAFCYILCNIIMIPAAQAQLIPCDGSYYLFLSPGNNPNTSAMYHVKTNPSTKAIEYELINKDLGRRVTAAGYSVWQQQIYALDYNTRELLKIDVKGNITAYPIPIYLDTLNDYFAGEVSPSGGNLLVVGRDKKISKDLTLFSIRLYDDSHIAGKVSILSDFATNLEDLAFDPVRGVLYGYDTKSNKISWVNGSSGGIYDYFSRPMPGVGILGSLFFDRSGQLHAYGSAGGSEENTFFNINKLHGELQDSQYGPSGRFSDGCGCPYTVRAFKKVTPTQILPCSELTVTYDVINHAGTAYSYISVKDTFPPGFIIKNIIKKPVTAVVASGEGSNILDLKDIDMILDTNRIIITLEVSDEVMPGTYASRAVVGTLPDALGTNIYSDASNITIIGNNNKENLIQQRPLCNGEGILLKSDVNNVNFQWSTGDTTATTIATAVGWYALTVTSACNNFVDSLYINALSESLQVQLNPVAPLELGDVLNMTPQMNTNRSLTYEWSASDSTEIACPACPMLTTTPVQNTVYTLTVTDEYGCQARDSVAVAVIPVRHIFAPTAFSPNGDGVNDIFYLQGKINARIIYLRIYDRWGNEVFQVQNGMLNDPMYGWDGTAHAKTLATQAFVFTAEIEFPDGVRKRLSGEVSLLR